MRLDLQATLVFAAVLTSLTCLPALADTESSQAEAVQSNEKKLDLQEARTYMLSLINRDREKHGAGPVELDDVANRAAQWHADDMAEKGFNSHWHPEGSKPPQRYNESGGLDYVGENSHGSGFEKPFSGGPSEKQLFTKKELEEEESVYFDEKPPNDGHRKNILDPLHTHVGLGLRLVDIRYEGEPSGTRVVSAQEFVSRYGTYSVKLREFKKGSAFVIDGDLQPGIKFYDVDVAREDLPEPIKLAELQAEDGPHHGGYGLAKEHVTSIFPPPFVSSPFGTATIDQNHFHCEIVPGREWQRGLYYVIVWAEKSGSKQPFVVSLLTVPLEQK